MQRDDASFIERILNESVLPLEVDIHFNPGFALNAIKLNAPAIRINPGNIKKKDLREVIQAAKENKVPIRIGVNIGSLPERYRRGREDSEAMVQLAREYVEYFQENGFDKILLSLKSDSVLETYQANLRIAKDYNYPLHLGVTATGIKLDSIVKSSIGIGALLLQGIGDTIRVSYTGSALEEVRIAKSILSSLGLRKFGPEIIACPGCSRAEIDIIKLAEETSRKVKDLNSSKPLKIAVMGCEVNGPGEAKSADLGIAGGKRSAILFKKGKILKKISEGDITSVLLQEVKTILEEEN
jgi:(E)-4-hydroxy-3-methylbut-2-enyl-diphosphate synthase